MVWRLYYRIILYNFCRKQAGRSPVDKARLTIKRCVIVKFSTKKREIL